MLRTLMASLLGVIVTTVGCASAQATRLAPAPSTLVEDRAVLADYVQRLPAGSRVRVERSDGRVLRGTLMNATSEQIVLQENTRVPERPVDIPLSDIARVALDSNSSSIAKSIGIGVASGVGGTLGVIAILAALWSD